MLLTLKQKNRGSSVFHLRTKKKKEEILSFTDQKKRKEAGGRGEMKRNREETDK